MASWLFRIFLLLLPIQLPLVKAFCFHTNVKLMVSCADEGSACFLRTELTAFFKSWTINLIHWSAHKVCVSHYILICLKDNCDFCNFNRIIYVSDNHSKYI